MNKFNTTQLFKSISVREQIKILKSLYSTSLSEFSAATGLSVSHISGYLSDNKTLKIDAIEEIATMFGYRLVLIPIEEDERIILPEMNNSSASSV